MDKGRGSGKRGCLRPTWGIEKSIVKNFCLLLSTALNIKLEALGQCIPLPR